MHSVVRVFWQTGHLKSLEQADSEGDLVAVGLCAAARMGVAGFVSHVFGSRLDCARLQVGDEASEDNPTGSEVGFADVADLTKVRGASSRLR